MNRRLADSLAREGGNRWEVTAVAPNWLPGDLRPVPFEPAPEEANRTERVNVYLGGQAQLMHFGRRLKAIIQSRPWDLIHAWQEPYVFAGAQIGWYAGRQPVVYYTFQNLAKRYPPPFNWLENWTINRSAGWIAAGRSVEQTLLPRSGYARKPHTVISLGIDAEVFRPDPQARKAIRDRLGLADGPPVIGFLGRFVPEKGLALLQNVLDQLKPPGELCSWAPGHSSSSFNPGLSGMATESGL